MKLLLLIISIALPTQAKEIALTFDDAPMTTSQHFDSLTRTEELINNLEALKAPPVMIFANPCKRIDSTSVINQLKKYRTAGHLIGNHTCSHPRLDDVGFTNYINDIKKADILLTPLFSGQKYFRYPYLNEGIDNKTRDQVRQWLKDNQYKNGYVSLDNDDYYFSFKINEAKEKGKKIDYERVKTLFIQHILSAVKFYDDLAIKTVGYSPKHIILLHEMDATVMFIRPLVEELRKQGWKLISIEDALKDKIYTEEPKNTYTNNGVIAQLAKEKTGETIWHDDYDHIQTQLNKILDLND